LARVSVDVEGVREVSSHLLSRVANIVGGNKAVEVYFSEAGNRSKLSNAGKVSINANEPFNRNPFWLKPALKGVMTRMLKEGLTRALRQGRSASGAAMAATMHDVGEWLVATFKKQLLGMTYEGGHRDLSPRYKKRKQKKVGFVYPILKRHGDLLKSISYRVVK
jgi:hypothetical protein